MKHKARREKCIEMTYEYIRDYGPCRAASILPVLNRKYRGDVMMNELSRYIAYLHGTGRIEDLMDEHGHRMWKVCE